MLSKAIMPSPSPKSLYAFAFGLIFASAFYVNFALAEPDGAMSSRELMSACKQYMKHNPAAGVAYQGGLVVHGRKVVGAELSPALPDGAINPNDVTIPLDVNLTERLGINLGRGVETNAEMGYIQVKDGQISVNGEPLSDTDQDWTTLCDDLLGVTP